MRATLQRVSPCLQAVGCPRLNEASVIIRAVATTSTTSQKAAVNPREPGLTSDKPESFTRIAKDPKVRNFEKKFQPSKSFALSMFTGKIVPDQLFPYPDVLTDDQRQTLSMLVEPAQKFFETINDAAKNDALETVPAEITERLKELGFFGLQVPEQYGGVGLTNTQYAKAVEIAGCYDLGMGIYLGAHQSIGFKGITLYGNDAQKQKYLPDLAAGKRIAAYCLTEPSSGSDASSIRSRAVKSADGKHYVLNGSKIWISNGGIAEIFTVFAQTPQKDEKSGEIKDKITAFIVERQFGGVTHGPPEKKMGIKCSNTAEVYFDNVKIPIENVLGGEGEGFKVAMNILNNGRFGMAAALSGTMKVAIKKAVEHASQRRQFGSLLSEFETTQEKLAKMAMAQYVTESMAYHIAGIMDQKATDFQVEAAISKVVGSENAWYVVDEAIQILGGMGYMKECGLERFQRDLRIFRIFEGTNDILRLFTALTGMQYAGSGLKELQRAFKDPTKNMSLIFDEAGKRALRVFGMSARGASLGGAKIHPSLSDAAMKCAKSVENFSASVEWMLVKYGKGVINQQFLLNRIAHSAIDIYGMAAALSRCTRALEQNYATAEHEKLLVQTYCTIASARVAVQLGEMRTKNYSEAFDMMRAISKGVIEGGGIVTRHPLGV